MKVRPGPNDAVAVAVVTRAARAAPAQNRPGVVSVEVAEMQS